MSYSFEILLALFALSCLVVGGFSIFWARHASCTLRMRLGRWLSVSCLVALGGAGLIAAVIHAEGLAPLGLLAGLLVVAMLWEAPSTLQPAIDDR